MRTTRTAARPVEPVEPVPGELVEASPPTAPAAPYTRAWLHERIDGRIALAVGVTWFVLYQIAMLLEPATSHAVPVIGVVLELVMWTLLATMLAGLIAQRRWGLPARSSPQCSPPRRRSRVRPLATIRSEPGGSVRWPVSSGSSP